ncbi:MAG: PorP/SprF family type IX secretion system membrane protein [Crocinitomicaceae bacterium]|jgi:type IX secretion system PorP/SprF family membrane protein|nr:PorP/SprF family type IX secretion system membrane protein [Crocinitomicaceae bacterium]
MKFRLLYLLAFLTCFSRSVSAQDVHWSQYFNNPVYLSPSNTGNFDADIRLIGNYRNQWKSVTIPYSTFQFSGEYIVKNFQNISFGVQFLNDAVGDGNLTTNELVFTAAQQISLPAFPDSKLRAGLALGFQSKRLNPSAFYFDNQFINGEFEPTAATGETNLAAQKSSLSSGIGLSFEQVLHPKHILQSSWGLFNLSRPNQGFYGAKVIRDLRSTFSLEDHYSYSDRIGFQPGIFLNKQGKYTEFILGSRISYVLNKKPKEYTALLGGLYYRWKDALYLYTGLDYQNWRFGLSYDFNFSKLTPASNVRGGIELSVRYLIYTFKPKNINHRVCPDYI